MARRDLRRHRLRALLTCVLVALPVVVATVAALGSYNTRWDPEQEARHAMGAADAQLQVSPFVAVRRKDALWFSARPAEFTQAPRTPVRRDPAEVDPAALLPSGASLVPMPTSSRVDLATGGSLWVQVLDLDASVTDPFVEITGGRAPETPEELAVPEVVADELGFLENGALSDDAEIVLADGTALQVVGIAGTSGPWDEGSPTSPTSPGPSWWCWSVS
jgi:putative ABC transport system permease protein